MVGHLGPDPLRSDWDPSEAVARLRSDRDRPLAAALLDQRNLAGLGNLWANEHLPPRLQPLDAVGEIDVEATVALAARALRHSALTPGALQVTTGNRRRGAEHWVSGRAGEPCRRCADDDPCRRRAAGGPGPAPDLVVPALPAGPRPRPLAEFH